MSKRASEETKRKAVQQYKNGMSVELIAEKCGYSSRQIYMWLRDVRKRGHEPEGTKRLSINKQTAEALLKLIAVGADKLTDKEAAVALSIEKRLLDVADELTVL